MTDELKQLAQAATPGPWWTVSIAKRNRPGIELVGVFGDSTIIHGGDGIAVADAFNDRTFAQDNANMAYIAAASPSVVLDLIAQRDAALLRLKVYEEEDAVINRQFLDIKDKRCAELELIITDLRARTTWQPIETAPRNWSAVMLFAPNYNDDWRQVFEGYYDPDRLSWYDRSDRPVSPTHWQPLPAPPVTAHTEARRA